MIHPEIEKLALKFQCDPQDPVFGIMEAVIQMRDAFHNNQVPLLPEAKKQLESVVSCLENQMETLKREANQIATSRDDIATHMREIQKYWLQARWYYGLFGSVLTAVILGGVGASLYYVSADRLLSQSHVELYHSQTQHGNRLVLSGSRVLTGNRTANRIEAEFER